MMKMRMDDECLWLFTGSVEPIQTRMLPGLDWVSLVELGRLSQPSPECFQVSQDLPLRRPCWDSTSISCSNKCCTRMCSNVLQRNWPVIAGSYFSPFLYMGATLAWRQSSGRIAWIRDRLKMQARTWAISALHSFNTQALRSSLPEALLGLRQSRNFLTQMGSIDISSIYGYRLGPFKRMSPAFSSRVFTDPNCLLNMLALSLLFLLLTLDIYPAYSPIICLLIC